MQDGMAPPPPVPVLLAGLGTWGSSVSNMFGRNPLRDGSPGWHLPAPDELKECGVDRQRIEAGDADEGAVEGALPHLQGVEACPAHGVPACQGHRRLLCCLRHRNCCLVVLSLNGRSVKRIFSHLKLLLAHWA